MTTPTLGSVTLTGCENIRVDKNANIIPIPIPTTDSDQTEIFDLLGVIKSLSVTGTFAESTVAATKALVDALEALVDGNQTTINFNSDQTGTVSVMVGSVNTNWDVPGFKCSYEIKLIQGS